MGTQQFDSVISSLAFHYIESFEEICKKVRKYLITGGSFVFSIEHPVFTAQGNQDWHYDADGKILHWPVDSYFKEGRREAVFLGESVTKYHKTMTTYINTLLQHGFRIKELVEPRPDEAMLYTVERMADELRRPMMLIISAEAV